MQNNRWFRAEQLLGGAVRKAMIQAPFLGTANVLVNEYPKSGGTWLANMICEAIDMPFPRNSLPSFKPSIYHGHYKSNSISAKKKVIIWRDGRDVMVSWYFHCLFRNEIKNSSLVDHVAKYLCFDDNSAVMENMPTFLEYSFTQQKHPNFSWSEFVRYWKNSNCKIIETSYEELRRSTENELSRVVIELTGDQCLLENVSRIVEKYDFKTMSMRSPGTENNNSFMRKGIVGDWKNVFNDESMSVFKHYAGQELIDLGYESNFNW